MHPIRILWFALFAVSTVLGLPLRGQDSPYVFENRDGVVRISLADEPSISVEDFIRGAQRVTGKVFTYDRQTVAGQDIRFVGTVHMPEGEFAGFFQTMLYMNGFDCIYLGEGDTEVVEVVQMQGPSHERRRLGRHAYVAHAELQKYRNAADVLIVTTIPLDHIVVQAASQRLRPWIRSGMRLGSVGTAGALLVEGPGDRVYTVARLVELIDVPDPREDIYVVKLAHRSAKDLAAVLNEFLGETRPDVRVQPHEETNSVLIGGRGQAVKAIEEVIQLLDR